MRRMTNRNREREWGATDRGFRLCYYLLQRKMTTQQVADLLGYGSYSGADSLLKRLRTTLGNALHLPWPDGTFDAICTSPAYGNRMADRYSETGESERLTYAAMLRRQLHPDNAGQLQWGQRYRDFHLAAWPGRAGGGQLKRPGSQQVARPPRRSSREKEEAQVRLARMFWAAKRNLIALDNS